MHNKILKKEQTPTSIDLIQKLRELMKEDFILETENSTSAKTTRFLSFQISTWGKEV